MSVPDDVRRDAEKTGELVRKKLMEIMDLQADIDVLLRDKHPTPFGSKNWQYADIESLDFTRNKGFCRVVTLFAAACDYRYEGYATHKPPP